MTKLPTLELRSCEGLRALEPSRPDSKPFAVRLLKSRVAADGAAELKANRSGAAMSLLIGPAVADIADFKLTKNCNARVPAAGSCRLGLAFDPASAPATSSRGQRQGENHILYNAPNSPQSIRIDRHCDRLLR